MERKTGFKQSTRPMTTYDGGHLWPRDPFYYTVDPPKPQPEEPKETEEARNRRLYVEAVDASRWLSFRYAGGSQPGERRTVRPLNACTETGFKAQQDGVLKTYLYSLITEMALVDAP